MPCTGYLRRGFRSEFSVQSSVFGMANRPAMEATNEKVRSGKREIPTTIVKYGILLLKVIKTLNVERETRNCKG
jgi:hypothetical protein